MPMFDFECEDCHNRFEELLFDDEDDFPICAKCGGSNVKRLVAMPSPTLKNPFPYKIGPVNQVFVDNVRKAEARAAAGLGTGPSGCASCPHSQAAQSATSNTSKE